MAVGSVNVPGTTATTDHNGLMSAADKRDLETLKGLIPFTLMERAASGNPATFSDGVAGNLQNLTVSLTPIQPGSGDPSPTNIRAISGVSSVIVKRLGAGKNLVDAYVGYTGGMFTLNSDGSIHCSGTTSGTAFSGGNIYSYAACPWKLPPGTYTYSISGLKGIGWASLLAFPKSASSQYTMTTGSMKTFTLTEDTGFGFWIGINENQTVSTDVYLQIESGSVATAYEPYQGASVTVPLVNGNNAALTVYGGTLDVTAGTLTVTWANIPSYNGDALPGRWMSDRDVYAAGTSPTTGAQVVYELAPADYQTYSLTAQSMAALSGYNRVFSVGAGAVSATYRADPTLAYEELMNAILSAGAGI